MELLIIRHADAGDANEWAKTRKPDSQRPLSDKGREQIKDAARTLVKLVPKVDLFAVSPYIRALQTAELVFERYTETRAREITDSLVPEAKPDAFIRWLRAQGPREVVAVVGHEPHLSTLATWLIAGLEESRLELKKGGACLIAFERFAAKKEGTLQWLMGPKQLRHV